MALNLNRNVTLKAKGADKSNTFYIDRSQGNEVITFLLDIPLFEKNNTEETDTIVKYLEAMARKAGITSYVIVSAVDGIIDDDDLKKTGLTKYYCKHDSGWYQNVICDFRNRGITADVVVAFGPSLYQITKTGTDFTVDDLYYEFLDNYVYIGHGFEGDLGMFNHLTAKDIFVFPQYAIQKIFMPSYDEGVGRVIELGSWKMNFMVSVLKKIAKHQYKLPKQWPDPVLHHLQTYEEVVDFFKSHFNEKQVAFDTETSGFDFILDKLRCVQFSFDGVHGYYIEWALFEKHPDLVKLMSDMLLSIPNRITQNGKFDIKFLWQAGVSRKVVVTEDAMEMAHVLCTQRKKGLKTQSYYFTELGGYDHMLDEYIARQKKILKVTDIPYSTLPFRILFPYSTMDPIMTIRTYEGTLEKLLEFDKKYPTEKKPEWTGGEAKTAYSWYKDFVMELHKVVCQMEFEGMIVDEEVMDKHREILKEWEAEDRRKLVKIFEENYHVTVTEDYPFTSQTQLGKLLEKAGWPCHGLNKDKTCYKTDDVAFTEWARDGLAGVKELLHLRQSVNGYHTYIGTIESSVDKKKGAIIDKKTGWLQFVRRHPDGTLRMHCVFGVCLNETFRCRSSNPNFQNIPTRGKIAPLIKQCITTPVADMFHITGESGKVYDAAELDYVRVKDHWSGQPYIEARFLKEDDTIEEIEPVVVDYETGIKLCGFNS